MIREHLSSRRSRSRTTERVEIGDEESELDYEMNCMTCIVSYDETDVL